MNSSFEDNFFFSTHVAVHTDRIWFEKMIPVACDDRRPTFRPRFNINHKDAFSKFIITPETQRKAKSYAFLDINNNDPPCHNDIVIPQEIQGNFKGDVECKAVMEEQPKVAAKERDGKDTKKDDKTKEKSLMERFLSFFGCGPYEHEYY